jgi:hypothetical protein
MLGSAQHSTVIWMEVASSTCCTYPGPLDDDICLENSTPQDTCCVMFYTDFFKQDKLRTQMRELQFAMHSFKYLFIFPFIYCYILNTWC